MKTMLIAFLAFCANCFAQQVTYTLHSYPFAFGSNGLEVQLCNIGFPYNGPGVVRVESYPDGKWHVEEWNFGSQTTQTKEAGKNGVLKLNTFAQFSVELGCLAAFDSSGQYYGFYVQGSANELLPAGEYWIDFDSTGTLRITTSQPADFGEWMGDGTVNPSWVP